MKRTRKKKQLQFSDVDSTGEWELAQIPAHITIVETANKSIEHIVETMTQVPLDKSILLDFLIGRERGGELSEEQAELYRLQSLLNSRYHGERFDWLGDNPLSQMVRGAIVNETWKPKLKISIPVIQPERKLKQ